MNDIKNLQPPYYDNIDEFGAIADAEDSVIGAFNDNINRQLLNFFISTSDEDGVTLKEHEFNMVTDTKKSLDDRKTALKLLLQPPKPITFSYLKYLFNQLNFNVRLELDYDRSILYVYIDADSFTTEQVNRINSILSTYVPANVVTKVFKYEYGQTTLDSYIGVANTIEFYGHSDIDKGDE